MNYLVIDNTMTRPIRGVYCPDIRAVQSTRALPGQEIKAYAQWIGLNGGRALLDAFELQLINDGVLHIAPHDEDGFAHPGLCEAIETFRTDEGLRIIWQVKTRCRACRGRATSAPTAAWSKTKTFASTARKASSTNPKL